MIAIDSSALIAIFRLEPETDALLKAIVQAQGRAMSALNVLECTMVMSGGAADAAAFEPLDAFLVEAGIQTVPFDVDQACLAREAFLRFGKGRHEAGLNMGGCAAYALAKSKQLPLLFKGDDFRHTDIVPACPSSPAETAVEIVPRP
jgi:ribonuclease VapC